LYHQISARYVAAADSTSLAQRLGEEQARGARLNAELEDARTTIDAAERQRIALTEQLDSLKAIEERINRDATVRGQ
jgi:small-conductance mechanosensitive channel